MLLRFVPLTFDLEPMSAVTCEMHASNRLIEKLEYVETALESVGLNEHPLVRFALDVAYDRDSLAANSSLLPNLLTHARTIITQLIDGLENPTTAIGSATVAQVNDPSACRFALELLLAVLAPTVPPLTSLRSEMRRLQEPYNGSSGIVMMTA